MLIPFTIDGVSLRLIENSSDALFTAVSALALATGLAYVKSSRLPYARLWGVLVGIGALMRNDGLVLGIVATVAVALDRAGRRNGEELRGDPARPGSLGPIVRRLRPPRVDALARHSPYPGNAEQVGSTDRPVDSDAARDLIARALAPDERPLYVVAIGAITNVASAVLLAPEIANRIVVVWLGGHPFTWHVAPDFNMRQDMVASRVLFDCGVPFVRLPCVNVTEHLITTLSEMERFVKGRGAIGDYLYEIFEAYRPDHYARSKQIWDIGPIAWLIDPSWAPSAAIHSPILTPEHTWSHDPRRHFVREAIGVNRDAIFADLFRRIERAAN